MTASVAKVMMMKQSKLTALASSQTARAIEVSS